MTDAFDNLKKSCHLSQRFSVPGGGGGGGGGGSSSIIIIVIIIIIILTA